MTDRDPEDPQREEDLDEPIRSLAELREQPGPDFLERIRSRIDRRETASHLVTLSWLGLATVLVEFAWLAGSAFGSKDTSNGDSA